MNELVKCLAPAFAAGFAVQRLLEMIDSIFGGFPKLGDRKKLAMVIASVVLATALSFGGIRVLTCLSPKGSLPDWVEQIVTILFISGGTEGFNALLKFLNYKKEDAKGAAAASQSDAVNKKIGGKDALSFVGGS